jgi:hypothetical protein
MHVLRRPVEIAAGADPATASNINNHLAARDDPKQTWPLIRPKNSSFKLNTQSISTVALLNMA